MSLQILALASLCLAACSTMKPDDFALNRPVFEPDKFFSGRTESIGVLENRSGMPIREVRTQTTGTWNGGVLRIEQDLTMTGKPPTHRSWRLRRIDNHHFEATANDIVGTARGEAQGNVFYWSFTLAASPGNPLANVTMSQWMYLQPDGQTMVNHTTFRKAGIVLVQVTEQFRKKR